MHAAIASGPVPSVRIAVATVLIACLGALAAPDDAATAAAAAIAHAACPAVVADSTDRSNLGPRPILAVSAAARPVA